MTPTRISSYSKVLNGKVVRVNGYTVNRGAADGALRMPGRPFISASPGQFPNDRALPNIFPIDEVHNGPLGQASSVEELRARAEQFAADAQAKFQPTPEKLPDPPKKVSRAQLVEQLRRMEEMLSDSTVGTADKMRKVLQYIMAAENVMTAAEAAKTTSRAMSKLRGG